MRLYIANVTKQKQIVSYRIDSNPQGGIKFTPPKQQEIEPGRQVVVGADMHISQIEMIVDQLSRYGLIGEVDVPRMGNTFHPYIFNIGKPVSAHAMRTVRDHNFGVKVKEGNDRRKKSAVAANDLVTGTVAEQFAMKGIDAEPPDKTDVVFEQIEQTEAEETMIAEGVKVRPSGRERAERAQGKPGRTAAKRNARKRR